tara:strand:- start:720 stop:1001 length:282 start_codon:yes stop_codon:yes gene_type:complete
MKKLPNHVEEVEELALKLEAKYSQLSYTECVIELGVVAENFIGIVARVSTLVGLPKAELFSITLLGTVASSLTAFFKDPPKTTNGSKESREVN